MAPYFSVILPVYNVEAYLQRCVRSLLEQSFTDYELILVDDGSQDSSGRLCDELACENACIRVHHKENGGLSSARNAGLELAQGQYVWFVDSDDWVEPGSLQRLYEQIGSEKPDMVKFNYNRVTESAEPAFSNARPGVYAGTEIAQLMDQAFYSAGKFVLSAWSHIYNREFLKVNKLVFVSERVVGSEDYPFNLEAMLLAQKICVIEDRLYNYELRMGSLSQSYKKDLPQRYARLYAHLREQYRRADALQKYEGDIAAFYLWHLLRGTCIPNEYFITNGHTQAEGRTNIRTFLSADTVRQAYACCDKTRFSGKKRLQLWAMKMRWEPLFYWLYVKKPLKKKGKSYENPA